MKNVGKIFGCLLPIIVALLCQIAVSFGFTFIYGMIVGIKMAMLGITDAAEQEAYYATQMDTGNIIMIITAFATLTTLIVGAVWYKKHKPAADLKWKEVVNGKLVAAMVLLGLSLQFLISTCLSMVYPILPQDMTDQYSELMEQLIGGNVVLSIVVTVILAPLAEEFLFRGVTMKKAQEFMPFMAANVLQAVLFGIYHMNWIQGVYAFVLGMLLGFTAEYFHSIWAAVLLHACVNGSAEILSRLPAVVTETTVGVIGIAVVGVALLFAAAKLFPKAKTVAAAENTEVLQENENV